MNHRQTPLGLALICLAAAPALAQTPPAAPQIRQPMSMLSPDHNAIQIAQGERVTVRRGADGKFEIKSDEVIQVSGKGGFTTDPAGAEQTPPTPASGEIIFSFAGSTATGMLLKVESGVDFPFRYHALMAVRDKSGKVDTKETSVCAIHPKIFTLEHWPHPIVAIVLSGFEKTTDNDFDCR
jgi:hypothetical protein